MKKILFLLLLLSQVVLAQDIPVTMSIKKGALIDSNQLKTEVAKLTLKINDKPDTNKVKALIKAATITGVPGPKGDKGDPGIQGPPGPAGSGSGGGSYFSIKSIKDYGAVENVNFIDNTKAIQNAIDDCLSKNIRTLVIPLGRFYTKGSLIVMKANGFCTLNIIGESSFWDSNIGSEIVYTGTQGFALGIQNGKGCKVKGVRFTGLFQPPFANDRVKFFACQFENFKDGICRDSQYSPHACIVIDPFTNLPGQLPADGGYPELKSYYGISPNFSSNTGSTGIEIEECIINNFVVGIISSVNGLTRNAEITIIHKIQFENCKLCIGGCTDQEKGNVIDGIYCWGGTHTIFGTALYGSGRMTGNWNIDHANLAGAVVRFIYNDQHGYFPTYVSHIFAESLGTWGTLNSEIASEVSDCHIDFANTWEGNDTTRTLITSWGENVVYRSCNFRFYDGASHRYKIEGNAVFDHCYFYNQIK